MLWKNLCKLVNMKSRFEITAEENLKGAFQIFISNVNGCPLFIMQQVIFYKFSNFKKKLVPIKSCQYNYFCLKKSEMLTLILFFHFFRWNGLEVVRSHPKKRLSLAVITIKINQVGVFNIIIIYMLTFKTLKITCRCRYCLHVTIKLKV